VSLDDREEGEVLDLSPLVGNEAVLEEAFSALQAGRLHHALCLTGPKGVGKSLAARHLGRAFLCPERSGGGRACGSCRSCRRVALGSHPDWMELRPSGASALGTISVDRVREMAQRVWRKPGEGVGRVVLIEAAHLLGVVGQNALLKTLEEPPPSTLFLLVTPRTAELLPTVLSRCQILRFAPLPAEQVRQVLSRKGSWSEEELEEALAFSEGSPGRALAFLEEGGRVLREKVRELLALPFGRWDPFLLTQEILALEEKERPRGPEEELTPAQARRRRVLLFVQLLQQEAAAGFRASLLEGARGGPYDPDPPDPERIETWLARCFQAEQNLLSNLDPALVLEVLLLDLAGMGRA